MTATLTTTLRRAAVVTIYVAMFVALVVLFLPLAGVTAIVDLARRQRWTATRTLVFFVWYLGCELVGLLASLAIWLAWGPRTGADRERFLASNYDLQAWWATVLGKGAFRIFGVRLEVHDHGYDFGRRPLLVFIRHASTADTVLAAMLLCVPHGLRLRYVLKRELLWDPCLDIVGNRLPNVFVQRDSAQTEQEVQAVAALARDLRPGHGVLIYPEGTRFSRAKKARIVAKLRGEGREAAADEAESLRHVLRPRSGGPLALLEAAPEADAIFIAHTGFEGSASFDRFFNGGLIDRTVHVGMHVVRAEDIPASPEGRRVWLMEQWRRVDDFIDAHQGATTDA